MACILCLGDSLTDCGRLFTSSGLGNGYVRLLDQRQKEKNLGWKILNRGNDGFTVMRLIDSISYIPGDFSIDLITILIGINDIALMMNTCRSGEEQDRLMNRFCGNYRRLLETARRLSGKLLLMEPFLFPHPQEYLTWFPRLREMSAEIGFLAEKYDCCYLKLQEFLNSRAEASGIAAVTEDGVHLTLRGHEFLADALFPAIQKLLC